MTEYLSTNENHLRLVRKAKESLVLFECLYKLATDSEKAGNGLRFSLDKWGEYCSMKEQQLSTCVKEEPPVQLSPRETPKEPQRGPQNAS